jgi:hypothetical protein
MDEGAYRRQNDDGAPPRDELEERIKPSFFPSSGRAMVESAA